MGTEGTWHDDGLPGEAARVGRRYLLLGLVGEGAMGTVYRARDTELDVIVALKILKKDAAADPVRVARLRNEVRLARRVTSPCVVRTFDLGEQEGERFLTMEFLDGGSLAESLADVRSLQPNLARHIAVEICEGLHAAHGAGVVHRDLKPANVMLGRPTPEGLPSRVAIADFGIADESGGSSGVGTPAYMSPEQVEGLPLDARADLYALGAILFEMLVGRRVWPGDEASAVARARLASTPDDPRRFGVPEALASVIDRCLSRRPEERPASAADVRQMLVDAVLDRDASVPSKTLPSARAVTLDLPPFRSAPEERWLGRSLAAELVEILSRSPGIRPRLGTHADTDARVDAELRRNGPDLELNLRLIDRGGFRLMAEDLSFPETRTLHMLELVGARVAGALVAQLPDRAAIDPQQLGPWLRARDLVRNGWQTYTFDDAREQLEALIRANPEDARVAGTLALLSCREAFNASRAELHAERASEAIALVRRALEFAPGDTEVLQAAGYAALYFGDPADAARMLRASLAAAPGNARSQTILASLLLEVGRLDDAERHLDVASELDPSLIDVYGERSRLLAYQRRWDAIAALTESPAPRHWILAHFVRCRYRLWSVDAPETKPFDLSAVPPDGTWFRWVIGLLCETITPDDLVEVRGVATTPNLRLRSARAQLQTEALVARGHVELGWWSFEQAVLAGCFDQQWTDHCPALDPLRARPEFSKLRDVVAARAGRVRAVLDDAS